MKPSSDLPWVFEKTDFTGGVATVMHCGDYRVGVETGIKGGNYRDGAIGDDKQDAAYIVHAANSYPRLIEALRANQNWLSSYPGGGAQNAWERTHILLRELGELE